MVLVNLKFILSSKEEKKISFIISLSILFELYNSKRCLQKLFFWISFIQSLTYENVKGNLTLLQSVQWRPQAIYIQWQFCKGWWWLFQWAKKRTSTLTCSCNGTTYLTHVLNNETNTSPQKAHNKANRNFQVSWFCRNILKNKNQLRNYFLKLNYLLLQNTLQAFTLFLYCMLCFMAVNVYLQMSDCLIPNADAKYSAHTTKNLLSF